MRASPKWIIALLATVAVSLATVLAPEAQQRTELRGADSVLKMLLGDGRRLFANQFFTMADVYFHGGYYPTIFDTVAREGEKAIANTGESSAHDEHEHAGHKHDEHGHCLEGGHDAAHEEGMDFLKEPHDWVERFGRNFIIVEHSHLDESKQREMLPWLKLAAEMDPQMTQTYVTAAYWLRKEKSQVNEARNFLLEGLRNNPRNDELLFELGNLYYDDLQDTNRARNVMTAALQSWFARPGESKTNNIAITLLGRIAVKLAHIESGLGNYPQAISYLQLGKTVSPNPDAIEQQIQELRTKAAGPSPESSAK